MKVRFSKNEIPFEHLQIRHDEKGNVIMMIKMYWNEEWSVYEWGFVILTGDYHPGGAGCTLKGDILLTIGGTWSILDEDDLTERFPYVTDAQVTIDAAYESAE